jgi:non-specific serine/threonine protein kinase
MAVVSGSHNLPVQLTTFVGRRWEIAEVCARLDRARLVTLTGVGGVGKSRLALEVAATLKERYADGVWLVELAGLADPNLVPSAVADVVDVPEPAGRSVSDALATRLRGAELLLVLDNCEHLVGAVADLVQHLVAASEGLRVLVTSRERLGVTGEVLWLVAGLRCPTEGVSDPATIEEFDAARLFLDRAVAVERTFRLSETNGDAVARICRRLDGLPLAVELAAARVNALGVEGISDRLDDRFRLLTGGARAALARHRTLRAVVEWSYALLDERERELFDRLAVFVGGFTLEAAEEVCGDAGRIGGIEDVLLRLIDKSLVVAEPVSENVPRYRLLETLRIYGVERLQARGEVIEIGARHASYVGELAELAAARFRGPEQSAWLDRLETEHGNVRAALERSLVEGDVETAVRLAGAVAPFWDLHGHYTEGRRWLERALAAMEAGAADARVRAFNGLGTLALIQGDLDRAIAACEAAADISRRIGDQGGLAYALQYRGFAALYAEDIDGAVTVLEESLAAARRSEDTWLEGWSLIFLTTTELSRGDFGRAIELADKARRMLEEVEEPEGMAWAALIHGTAAWARSDTQDARMHTRDGLHRMWKLRARWGLSLAFLITGLVAGAESRWDRAARLIGASEGLRESIGAGHMPFVRRWLDTTVDEARNSLGSEVFENLWTEGANWSLQRAAQQAANELETSLPLSEGPGPVGDRTVTAFGPPIGGRQSAASHEAIFRKDGEYWTMAYDGPAIRLRDSLGLGYLARLIRSPNKEFHVLDLAAAGHGRPAHIHGSPPSGPEARVGPGDAGPVLDDKAKAAYRQRLEELAEELEEAERWADIGRADRARTEIDALTDQLASAVGLGGRDRRAASEVERARVNVTKAIRAAISRMAPYDPTLAHHLERSVRTGAFCSYSPDAAVKVTWKS